MLFRSPPVVQHETESKQMCVRGDDRKILRVHGVLKADEQNVCASDWKECGSLCGQHAGKKHTGGRALE